jgi:hypothetical protein
MYTFVLETSSISMEVYIHLYIVLIPQIHTILCMYVGRLLPLFQRCAWNILQHLKAGNGPGDEVIIYTCTHT